MKENERVPGKINIDFFYSSGGKQKPICAEVCKKHCFLSHIWCVCKVFQRCLREGGKRKERRKNGPKFYS